MYFPEAWDPLTLLPQSSQCWAYKTVPPRLAVVGFGLFYFVRIWKISWILVSSLFPASQKWMFDLVWFVVCEHDDLCWSSKINSIINSKEKFHLVLIFFFSNFLKDLFIVLYACMYVCIPCVCLSPWRSEEDFRSLGTGLRSCESPHKCFGLSLCWRGELQFMDFCTQPSLHLWDEAWLITADRQSFWCVFDFGSQDLSECFSIYVYKGNCSVIFFPFWVPSWFLVSR